MPRIPERYSPYLFAVIQAGLTSGVATAVATLRTTLFGTDFIAHWLASWAVAWIMMVPIVVMAAPAIQTFVRRIVKAID